MKKIFVIAALALGTGIAIMATRSDRTPGTDSSGDVARAAIPGASSLPAAGPTAGAAGATGAPGGAIAPGSGLGQAGAMPTASGLPVAEVGSTGVATTGSAAAAITVPAQQSAPATGQAAGSANPAAPTAATPGSATGGPGTPATGATAGTTGGVASSTSPTAPTAQNSQQATLDPTTILRRASTEYSNLRAFQADFTQQLRNAIMGRTYHSRGMLYQRRPDRFLMRYTDPEGDVIVSDGTYLWYYVTADPGQVIRSPASAGAGFVDLQSQFVGDPTQRYDYQLHGQEQVAGRDAHVLTLIPKERGVGYRSLKVWLDTRDYLARRFEITEDNGNVRRIDLANLQVNPTLPDSLFRYSPPPNVRVVDR
jgi:chaperone LolA